MHHNPAKNVLHVKQSSRIARPDKFPGRNLADLRPLLDSARSNSSLLAACAPRRLSTARFIPAGTRWPLPPTLKQPVFSGWTARRDFALRTLDRLLADAWDGDANSPRHRLPGWRSTAEKASRHPRRLRLHRPCLHRCLVRQRQDELLPGRHQAGRRHDRPLLRSAPPAPSTTPRSHQPAPPRWALSAHAASRFRTRPPPPATPPRPPRCCALKLSAAAGDYREIAEDTLASFAGIVEHFGLYAGSYGLALERFLLDPVQVVVVGSGPQAARLEAMAVARFAINKTVMRIAPFRLVPGGIPRRWPKRCSGSAARRMPMSGRWSAMAAPACRPLRTPGRCVRRWNGDL